jgi:hypothetical protein
MVGFPNCKAAIWRQFMQTILLSHEEVGRIAEQLYENGIRQKVESEENIGKMVLIGIETGDYEIDKNGWHASKRLNQRHPDARLFRIRIGYNLAASLGAVMERISQ